MEDAVIEACRETMAEHAKSFSFAARFLRPAERDAAAVYYAWCRHVDDAVDEVPRAEQAAALVQLRDELQAIASGTRTGVLAVDAFSIVRRRHAIPMLYAEELIEGMAMDVAGGTYGTLPELLRYCHRVAGVVGLTMCHVFGLRSDAALVQAAHMGWAMQLTNICRDVAEDWRRGRLYLPSQMLATHGWNGAVSGPLPRHPAFAKVIAELLEGADDFYESGDGGLAALPPRAALAVDAARRIYSAIGEHLRARAFDPHRGRASVPLGEKLQHAGRALGAASLRATAAIATRYTPPSVELTFEDALSARVLSS
ncbi:MAG: phytoene/squalene synthase family protein [Myxococcota bacterium]